MTSANNAIFCLTVQSDGKVLVGGAFTSIGGQLRNSIARVDATGVVDSFKPNASDFVGTIAVQSDGKILARGLFGSIGGQVRNRIARLDAASGAADSFNPAPLGGANVNVVAIAAA